MVAKHSAVQVAGVCGWHGKRSREVADAVTSRPRRGEETHPCPFLPLQKTKRTAFNTPNQSHNNLNISKRHSDTAYSDRSRRKPSTRVPIHPSIVSIFFLNAPLDTLADTLW